MLKFDITLQIFLHIKFKQFLGNAQKKLPKEGEIQTEVLWLIKRYLQKQLAKSRRLFSVVKIKLKGHRSHFTKT